jgi:hypothetical protein
MNQPPRPHPWILRIALVPSVALCAFLVLRTAHATPPAPAGPAAFLESRNVEIEVVDQAKDKVTDTTRFTLSLADGGRMASVNVPINSVQYYLNARCDPSNGPSMPISLSVRRHDTRPGSPAEISFDLTTVVQRNAKTSVGTVVRPDGSRTEVTVRMR